MDKVAVYNCDNVEIGKTYERRARQLVIKNKASWLDENRSAIRLTDRREMEDEPMDVYSNNGGIYAHDEAAVTALDDKNSELLMYLAKRNVRARKDLLMHVIAYPVVFIALLFITDGFNSRNGMPLSFYAGAYFVWSIVIASKMFTLLKSWLGNRKYKPDPIKAEYERLKLMNSGKINNEMKRL